MEQVKIGIVGVGDISGIYLKNITEMYRNITVYAVCDLVREKAERAQRDYHVEKLYDTMAELFTDENVDIVLNLTRPYEHYSVSKAALLAGKSVYSEKPLAATYAEGEELVAIAAQKGLLLGGAPDTFLGAGIQTCRKLIEDGFLGKPIGAAAFMLCHGHESWHPDPAFYYQRGGGPMMDMGPYYITALVNLLGGIERVTSVAATSFPQRTITSAPHYGETIEVQVPTHVNGILNFASGAVGTILTTFDVYYTQQARFEIYGSDGTLIVPDPNGFGGPILLYKPQDGTFREIPLCFEHSGNSRGLGLSDMADALRRGQSGFRCDCAQTLHVLEVLQSLQDGGVSEIHSPYPPRKPIRENA